MNYFLLLLLLFPLLTNGQNFPKKPTNYVTDNAKILTQPEQESLNAKLRAFEDSTSNQLFIYLDDRYASDLEDYSKKIFNTWGIGQKDKNNGILIAIFVRDREYRIQVGYSLEAALPADLCKQIQDEEMGPRFKAKDFYEGIDAGVDKLIYYSKNEFEPRSALYRHYPLLIGAYSISALFFVINLLSLRKWKNQPKRRRKNVLACTICLLVPLLGTIILIGLCTVINDKKESVYDSETDDAYERRMLMRRERDTSSDSSDDSFSGGGGGSSDRGGSSSSW